MLDKNPELSIDDDLIKIQIEFEQKNPNIILCSKPFHKIEFLNRLINSVKDPIIIVDMDLLYTGYVQSGMIKKKENVTIFCPDKIDWKEKLSKIISNISKERFLVIVDSFNGVYNLFDGLESARFINSCIMLLSSIGNQTKSSVIVTGMARKKDDDEWVLSPGGKHIIKSEKTGVYFLKKSLNDLVIVTLEKVGTNSRKFIIKQENV
ncbi:MAG: hypothetical protein H8D31_03075 [Nitrosopumilus sp.]|nr:hypothetical protein [Nitrosopumilus sp.]MBL7014932.1 hypothetical protein [Nitrosopumilus sp.]